MMRHEQRLIFELWQVRQVMPKALDREIESLGITMPQFGTLDAIAATGLQSGPTWSAVPTSGPRRWP